MKIKFKIIFLIMVLLGINGCKLDKKAVFKKKYYPSGKLKSYGWYASDTIPIDTLYSLYENGKLLSIDIFDSLGYYKQAIRYFNNGKINEVINYQNGVAQGFRYLFSDNGLVNKKYFYSDDVSVGDAYFYNNNSSTYNFYDWKQHNVNLIIYDSLGNIIKDIRQKIFIDSLKINNDVLTKPDDRSYDIKIIISNPPKFKSIVQSNM